MSTKKGAKRYSKSLYCKVTVKEAAKEGLIAKVSNSAVTNANGIATFVIGNESSVKATAAEEIATVNYTVQAPASSASMDAPTVLDDEYVESQQVSSSDAEEHKVVFKGGYPVITLPDTSSDMASALKQVEEINQVSGKYDTYANDPYYYTLKEDPSKLTYATLKFDNVTLSKYTELVVETYPNEIAAKIGTSPIDTKEYKGEMSQSSFNYEIPLDARYAGLCVKATLKSAGQVDTAKNDGSTLKNITYVYKTQQTGSGSTVALQNASVKWEIVDTPMTAEADYKTTDGTYSIGGKTITLATGEKLTEKHPAFPYTGTAILTHYDANGKVKAYCL